MALELEDVALQVVFVGFGSLFGDVYVVEVLGDFVLAGEVFGLEYFEMGAILVCILEHGKIIIRGYKFQVKERVYKIIYGSVSPDQLLATHLCSFLRGL